METAKESLFKTGFCSAISNPVINSSSFQIDGDLKNRLESLIAGCSSVNEEIEIKGKLIDYIRKM